MEIYTGEAMPKFTNNVFKAPLVFMSENNSFSKFIVQIVNNFIECFYERRFLAV